MAADRPPPPGPGRGAARPFVLAAAAIAATALVALLGATALYVFSRPDDRFAACRGSATAGDIGGPFTLTDETGASVTDAEVFAEPTLLYFGYTFCPDVCPVDVARNAAAVDLLAAEGMAVRPVFVSIDPKRDTPEVVADYTDLFHPRMLGLTGTPAQVDAAAAAWRVYHRAHDAAGDDYYLVDHSTQTYLVMPGAGFVDFFRRDDGPEAVARRTACFVAAAG